MQQEILQIFATVQNLHSRKKKHTPNWTHAKSVEGEEDQGRILEKSFRKMLPNKIWVQMWPPKKQKKNKNLVKFPQKQHWKCNMNFLKFYTWKKKILDWTCAIIREISKKLHELNFVQLIIT
jgi:hypothetical protein